MFFLAYRPPAPSGDDDRFDDHSLIEATSPQPRIDYFRDRPLAFLGLAFVVVVRVLVVLLAERRRTGFSVAGAVVAAAGCAGPRPSPICFASCERCSE
jgi:hypothetical protein